MTTSNIILSPIQKTAREWVDADPLFLDTETTGLDWLAQVCEIAVVNLRGEVLMNTLVKPTCPIPPDASRVHGITDEMVASAPDWINNVAEELHDIIRDRTVIIYNAAYDLRVLRQTAEAAGVPGFEPARTAFQCAMETYAEFYGDWNSYRQSYRWQSLANAAKQCGLALPENLHRALADAELTRQLVLHMALSEVHQ